MKNARKNTDIDIAEDIIRLSVNDMVLLLSGAYINLIHAGIDLRAMPSVMLWSAPGMGKSQGVRQLAKQIAAKTGKEAVVTDVRLLLFNPVDLRGIPVADAQRETAIWLKPKIFSMNPDNNVINILFLDEISAAPPSVQAAAYQIALDRTLGEHKLPENCIVIAAGNRVIDRSVAWQMPLALSNRMCHLEIACDMASWRHWAVENNIHQQVLGYLSRRPDQLQVYHPEDDTLLAFPTPRTWEMTSNVLHHASNNLNDAFPLICGCIGFGAASEFRAFCRVYSHIPPIQDIFSGHCSIIPKNPDELYALTSAIVSYASSIRNDMRAISHSITYALGLPPEFSTLLIRDYISFEEDYKNQLLQIPAFSDWIRRNGKYL